MSRIVEYAIEAVQNAESSFCKFISANDIGKTRKGDTKSHQSGFYIPISFCEIVFESSIQKGQDYVQFVSIQWQNDFTTEGRFKFYGSKNECHLTRLGKGFPYRTDDNLGDLLIICKFDKENYKGFVLNTDEDFDEFFAASNITATDTNRPINKKEVVTTEDELLKCFYSFIKHLNKGFPSTLNLSTSARDCFNTCYKVTEKLIKAEPDKTLLKWLDAEFQLFKAIEIEVYSETIKNPFKSVEELVDMANTILNRRKSRAGKSLEYHLAEVFTIFDLKFTPQAITEGNKKPDFIFPNSKEYHNQKFDTNKLIFLAAKTTCKDRWRQIINEADRIETKHLFTLQQGISKNQLKEMYKEGVKLVVPKPYLRTFPDEYQDKIFTLDNFIDYTISKQS